MTIEAINKPHSTEKPQQRRTMTIVVIYPVAVLFIGILLNAFVFGINPCTVALPSIKCVRALVIAAALLTVNHTWIMTATELTRMRFKLYATPEEWVTSGTSPQNASEESLRELERHHNTHRNTTENTIYYILLAFILVFVSPTTMAVQVWFIGFVIARLGYTYSYLAGKDGARGLFMTLGLLAMYGMASYLIMSLIA